MVRFDPQINLISSRGQCSSQVIALHCIALCPNLPSLSLHSQQNMEVLRRSRLSEAELEELERKETEVRP